MEYKLRQEMKALSKEVFGTTSRWQKILEDGIVEPHTRDREVMVPTWGGGVQKKTFTDTKGVTKRFTVDEVRKLMQDILDVRKGLDVKPASSSTPSVQVMTPEDMLKSNVTVYQTNPETTAAE